MKKQIITVSAVALVALLLFTSYMIFFRDSGIDTVGDPFFELSSAVKSELSSVESDITLSVSNKDGSDSGWETVTRFAEAVVSANGNFDMDSEPNGDFSGIVVRSEGGERELPFDSFFKTRYNGERYAFDGEALLANAILSLCGRGEIAVSLRALDGYDTDGDTVSANGNPYMFDSLEDRSEIAYLTVKNEHGEFSVYNDEGDFYFGSSRAVSYDEEMFSMLNTNCRIPLTYGKLSLPEGKEYSVYGLDENNASTGSYTIMTNEDKNGNYFLHTVYIGNLSSTGNYYYSRYVGGLFANDSDESDGDRLVTNLSKDFIYFLPASVVDSTLKLEQTDFMKPTIVNAISDTEQLFAIDNIRIDDYTGGISLIANRLLDFNAAPNLSAIDTSSLTKVISDKVRVSDLSSYSDGWYNHIDVFGGFSSSDGARTYISGALARKCVSGDYRVNFGLLRDEANGAYLPSRVIVQKSYDGYNWHDIEGGDMAPSSGDKSMSRYEVSFHDEKTVKFIRVEFDIPLTKNTYVVFDEINIYVDGIDAQPTSAIGGQWKLTSPDSLIASDRNYAYLDMINFNDFVQKIAALEGESVVGCGFSADGDATRINKEVLAPFGLDNPAYHYSFEYDGVVTELFVSKKNVDGKYYAYTVFTGMLNGKEVSVTTDVIVEISEDSAPWLAWSVTEYLDHSLLSMYLVDINELSFTLGGDEYKFDLTAEAGNLTKVTLGGNTVDTESFKLLYESFISIYMQDEYVPSEGDESEEYFRVKVESELVSPEIVFYRVSATKCYFTIDGEGSYYCLVSDVSEAIDDLKTVVSGGKLE